MNTIDQTQNLFDLVSVRMFIFKASSRWEGFKQEYDLIDIRFVVPFPYSHAAKHNR